MCDRCVVRRFSLDPMKEDSVITFYSHSTIKNYTDETLLMWSSLKTLLPTKDFISTSRRGRSNQNVKIAV